MVCASSLNKVMAILTSHSKLLRTGAHISLLDWIRVDSTENEYWDDKFLKGDYPEKEEKWFNRIKEIEEEKRFHIQNGLQKFIKVYEGIWW